MRSVFTQQFVVSGVLVATGGLALYSRSLEDPFAVPFGTPIQDANVLAYAPIVGQASMLLSTNRVDRRQLLSVAHKWDMGVKKGELVPLTAICFEDSPSDGERGQIMNLQSQLVASLVADAHKLAAKSKIEEAVSEVLLANRLSESLKYSDLCSVYRADREEKVQRMFFLANLPQLNGSSKEKVRAQLQAVVEGRQGLIRVTRLTRGQFFDWRMRMGKSLTADDIHVTHLVSTEIQTSADTRATMDLIRSEDEEAARYLVDLRLAWRSETENQAYIKRLLTLLDESPKN